jgi:hypothetical protein
LETGSQPSNIGWTGWSNWKEKGMDAKRLERPHDRIQSKKAEYLIQRGTPVAFTVNILEGSK